MGPRVKDFMNIKNNSFFKTIYDRDQDIEARMGVLYISTGVILAVIGLIICIMCHANTNGIIAVALIASTASVSLYLGFKKKNFAIVRNYITLMLIVLIPVVFVSAGGYRSGCTAWIIYQLYCITLVMSGRMMIASLGIASVIDIALCVMDYLGADFIYHLPTERDVFISTFLSYVVVCFGILVTVVAYKNMYREERAHLIKQSRELEAANEFEKMFLANMSHELRTPINSILGFAEMVKRSSDDKEVLEYAQDISTSSDHLLTLVNDILDLSKIEAGEFILNPNPYHILEGVQAIYDILKLRARDAGLDFIIHMDENIPSKMLGDRERDVQIALNLLTNGIKYTKKGSVTLDIHTERIPNDENHVNLFIVVTDTGIGIAPENINKIFDAYRRIDKNVSTIEGTGLGLAIARKYANAMEGDITVESTLGAGSVFTAVLKQEVLDWTPVGVIDVKREKEVTEEIYKQKTFDEKKTILVVDDTALNLKVISKLLKDSGCRIVTADSGQAAIDFVSEGMLPDLILMDIMMPNMDGVEAMNRIRTINDAVPVVALTADAINGSKEEYLSKGFDDYLSKPVKPQVLDKLIAKYI